MGALLKKSTAVIFLDLRQAYYSVRRQFSQLRRNRMMNWLTLRLPSAYRQMPCARYIKRLQDPKILDVMELDDHLTCLVMDIFNDTWFGAAGIADIARSTRSTKPGDPLAGMVFCLLMAKVEKQISDKQVFLSKYRGQVDVTRDDVILPTRNKLYQIT
jgi:hypothetical protein